MFKKINNWLKKFLPLLTFIGILVALITLLFAVFQIHKAQQSLEASLEPIIDILPRDTIPISNGKVKFSINNHYIGNISNIEITGTIVALYRYHDKALVCPLLYKTKPDQLIPTISSHSSGQVEINLTPSSFSGVRLELNSKAPISSAVNFLVVSIRFTRDLDERTYSVEHYYSIDGANNQIVDEEGMLRRFIATKDVRDGHISGETIFPIQTVKSSGILEQLKGQDMFIDDKCPTFQSDQNGAYILVPAQIQD